VRVAGSDFHPGQGRVADHDSAEAHEPPDISCERNFVALGSLVKKFKIGGVEGQTDNMAVRLRHEIPFELERGSILLIEISESFPRANGYT
jgi:hypothetical protein